MTVSRRANLVLAIGVPAALGVAGTFLSVQIFTVYSWGLFLGLPFVMSVISALIYRRLQDGSWGSCYGVSILSIVLAGFLVMLVALDGMICLIMALPLAAAVALVGSTIGFSCGRRRSAGVVGMALLLISLFPALLAFEDSRPWKAPEHKVVTRLAINAPIEAVWDQVIAFDRIKTPPSGIFRWGIAYPIEARIEGEGVGAIRYCVFSTGPFVEPITRWEAPYALEFDVSEIPAPMEEFSPWGHIETPHLHDTFTSKKGGFRLWEENGKTMVEGTTWYSQKIAPDWYWHRVADQIIHRIHLRVLNHIKATVEPAGAERPFP